MLEIGDIVLYRLCVSEVFQIETVKGVSYYRMRSLEGDECEFRVPLGNENVHIRTIPTEKELDELLGSAKDMEVMKITRTAVDKICRPILDSFDMRNWIMLLKTLTTDKQNAVKQKKKFSQKEAGYYHILLQRFTNIFSYVLQQDTEKSEAMLVARMDEVCA